MTYPIICNQPAPDEIIELRELVRFTLNTRIPQARQICAGVVGVSDRAWERWENGERTMSAALWELALIKLRTGTPTGFDSQAYHDEAKQRLAQIRALRAKK